MRAFRSSVRSPASPSDSSPNSKAKRMSRYSTLDRHHRLRRSLRRHGFQTLRHRRRRHRFPARPEASRRLAHAIMTEAIHEPRSRRGKILDVMAAAIAAPAHGTQQIRASHRDRQNHSATKSACSSGLAAKPSRASSPRPAPRLISMTTAPSTSTRTTATASPAPSRSSTA